MLVTIQQFAEWCLTQFTNWVGEKWGGTLFGVSASVLTVIMGVIGKRVIAFVFRRLRGDNQPVREFVQSLLTRMGDTPLWDRGSPALPDEASNSSALVVVAPKSLKVNGQEIGHTLNRHERRVLKVALADLLHRIDVQKIKTAEQVAEQVLRDALSKPLARQEGIGPTDTPAPSPAKATNTSDPASQVSTPNKNPSSRSGR